MTILVEIGGREMRDTNPIRVNVTVGLYNQQLNRFRFDVDLYVGR